MTLSSILVVLAVIVGTIIIAELNILEYLFQRKVCSRCRSVMVRTGKTDPQPMYILEDHKVELKCKRCGATTWLFVAGKSTSGGD